MSSLVLALVTTALLSFKAATAQVCVGQGAGSCQGVYLCDQTDNNCYFYIFNHACGIIGDAINPNVGDAIDSQLPYTVDIKKSYANTADDQVYCGWAYSNGEYGWGYTRYATGTDTFNGRPVVYMRSAFPDGYC